MRRRRLSNSFVFVATTPPPPGWADDRRRVLRLLGFALGSLALHVLLVGAAVREAHKAPASASLSERLQFVGETFEVDAERPEPDANQAGAPSPEPAAPTPEPARKPADHHGPPASPSREPPREDVRKDEVLTSPAPTPGREAEATQTPSRSEGRAADSPQASSGSEPSAAGNFGEAGAEAPTVQLRRAFVKTLPLAARSDPAWLTLPIDSTFDGTFVLRVDDTGVLSEITTSGAEDALTRAVIKNRLFLRAGRFAEREHGQGAVREQGRGQLRLRIRARIEQHEPLGGKDSTDQEGAVLVTAIGMRIDPSEKTAPPTGAYFTYGSGRHVEFEVSEIVP